MTRERVRVDRHVEPVLGSSLDVSIGATRRGHAQRAIGFVLAEIERWEERLSVHRTSSELRRWIDGDLSDAAVSDELAAVLQRSVHWERITDGRLSPVPGSSSDAAFSIDADGRVRRMGRLADIRIEAFAKGLIVDRVIEATQQRRGVVDVMINVGGDLRAVGPVDVRVDIEHPGRPFDNEPPIAQLSLRNASCATSGRSRRGDHIVHGRTGAAIGFDGSVTVRASSLESADAWATALCIDDDLETPDDVDVLILDNLGTVRRDDSLNR